MVTGCDPATTYSPGGVPGRETPHPVPPALQEPHEHSRPLNRQQFNTLTGPRSLTFDEAADRLGNVLGRPITYLPVGDDAKRKTLLGHGVPAWIVDMLEEYAQAYASGWGDFTTDTVAALLGRPPRDVSDFVRDHAAAFTPAPPDGV